MSTEEQDRIYGQAVRQAKDAARTLAAFDAKLSEFARLLTEAAAVLNRQPTILQISGGPRKLGVDFGAIDRMPSKEDIAFLLSERDIAVANNELFQKQLAAFE